MGHGCETSFPFVMSLVSSGHLTLFMILEIIVNKIITKYKTKIIELLVYNHVELD